MKKRLFCILLAVLLLLSVLPTAALAAPDDAGADILVEGDTPHRIHWTLYKDGTLHLSPNDKYSCLDNNERPWVIAYTVDGQPLICTLVIEDGISYIPEKMFQKLPLLESVFVNGALTEIGESAFSSCPKLRSVTIYGNVGGFDGDACWGGVRANAFNGCKELWNFHVDGRIANVGENAFSGANLIDILAPMCGDIGARAFKNNPDFYNLPPVRGSVCSNALDDTNIKGQPVFVVSSHHGDLSGLGATKTVLEWNNLAQGITAFTRDNFPNVYFTGTEAEFQAHFSKYKRSHEVQHLGEHVTWALDEDTGVLTISGYGSCIDLLYMVEQPWLNIPGRTWDENRERITKVRVPYGLRLGAHYLDQLEDRVEYYYDQSGTLGTVNWGISAGKLFVSGTGAIPSLYGRENDAWMPYRGEAGEDVIGNGINEIIIGDGITAIGFGAFMNCPNLERVTFADSITSVEGAAFYGCLNLNNVSLPYHLKTIGRNAFTDCTGLQRIFIPETVETIGPQCFDRTGLTDIFYGGTTERWNALNVSGVSGAFVHMSSPGFPPGASAAPTHEPNFFEDVSEDAYYFDAVRWAVREEITAGTDETHFSPDATCTRAQMVTFLWRTAGEPEPKTANNPFKDVAETAYYYKAVLWAAEVGITKGVDETHFAPEATVTRAQAATLLCRTFGGKAEGNNPFADVPANAYYADAVRWAANTGVTNGVDETHFSPDAPCLRCQIVTFLYRAVENLEPIEDAPVED